MKILQNLQKKKTRTVIGLMSGTSVDSLDTVIVKIRGEADNARVSLIAFEMYRFPDGFRELVFDASSKRTSSVDLICRLNILCAHFYADAVKKIIRKAGLKTEDIDLIGSHGQTIHHLPESQTMFGKRIRSTLQIGDPATLAKLTGIPTVGDFRTGDMALGGQGAPLVPYVDYVLFRSKAKNRILLNLGGIANFTALPANCSADEVIAFDTGPANMVIDALMMKLFQKKLDKNGSVGKKGKISGELLKWMMNHPYLKKKPPKSTGRELFGASYLQKFLKRGKRLSDHDLVATASAFTAAAVYDQYERFIRSSMCVDELLVSGGGMHNKTIMRELSSNFAPAIVSPLENLGIPSDAKEAVCFAMLANATVSEVPANLPSVTGAKKSVVLGKICL